MRRSTRRMVAGATAASMAVLLRPGSRGNKVVRRELDHTVRWLRYMEGRIQGVSYRLSGRHPDPAVIDNVLADRIRSTLGRVERRLDLPHIHVMVEHHVALLHGEVGSEADADEIEKAVLGVPGVAGIESYLHTSLFPGDTRPSAGRMATHPPSPALSSLLAAAEGAGMPSTTARAVVRGILATFADGLPPGQRAHVSGHLPSDVRPLLAPPRRIAGADRPARTVHDLVGRIVGTTAELPLERADEVTAAVIHALRALVPDDAGEVAAVLPAELRALWQGTAPV